MTPEQIAQLIDDAEQYPLPLRVAAAMYLDGVRAQQLFGGLHNQKWWGVEGDVLRALNALSTGQAQLTPRLEELARQLVGPQSVWVVQYLDDDGKYGATARRTHEEAYAIGSRERSWKLEEVQL